MGGKTECRLKRKGPCEPSSPIQNEKLLDLVWIKTQCWNQTVGIEPHRCW